MKKFVIIGSLMGFAGVALGAFCAHVLKDKLSADMFNVFEVGVRYHMVHALGMLAVAWIVDRYPAGKAAASGWLFLGGVVLFSGSLYIMSLTGELWLGMITPLGGLCFLAGWAWLGWCTWRSS